MIPLQIRSVNDAKDVLLVGKIVFRDLNAGNLVELFHEIFIKGNPKLLFQGSGNHLLMLWAVFPKIWAAGTLPLPGVCYVKHIFELGSVPGIVYECDSFCTSADVAAHAVVPKIVFCAGGGFGPLGIDHKLLMVGVFVEPGSGGQKVCPALIAASYFLRSVVC